MGERLTGTVSSSQSVRSSESHFSNKLLGRGLCVQPGVAEGGQEFKVTLGYLRRQTPAWAT